MSLALRLSLLLILAGCAEQLLMVSDSDWQTVPPAQRATLDKKYEADLAAAQAELTAAQASLAALPRDQAAMARPPRPTTQVSPIAEGDVWGAFLRDRELARGEAYVRVEAATGTVQRADASWRQLRADTARARLTMLTGQRELFRAQAVNRALPGDETYETAPLRGQFSQAQQRWYAVATKARDARDALERASRDLASSKEAYAQLMRASPINMPEPALADDLNAPMVLPPWSVARMDIRRRRGLRHFVDDSLATQQLRKLTYRLSPPPRSVALALAAQAAAAPAPAPAPGGVAQSPAPAPAPAAPAPAAVANKPAAAPPATTIANKPAAAPATASTTKPTSPPPVPPASSAPPPASERTAEGFFGTANPAPATATAQAKPAAPAPAPAAPPAPVEHPADRAASAPARAADKPAERAASAPARAADKPAERAATAPDHPADRAGSSPSAPSKPAPRSTAPTPPGSSQPQLADRAAAPAPATAPPATTLSAKAAPPRAPSPAAPPTPTKPVSAPAAPPSGTGVAKPIERPLPETVNRVR